MTALQLGVLLYVVVGIPMALVTAYKARRMGQSFVSWLWVGLALPVVSLAIVQYFEPSRRQSSRRSED